jgi:hypothetical protein
MAFNTANTNNGGLLGDEYIYNFLNFMDTDTSGMIGQKQVLHSIAIRSFINKESYALNFYQKFIKNNHDNFPAYSRLIEMIDTANVMSNSFIDKSHTFCVSLWGYLHH